MHNPKKVAKRYKVPVVFSAPRKLGCLCVQISGKPKRKKCEKKHAKHFVPCDVVYEIPPSCGEAYIGQMGRGMNDGARENNLSLNNDMRTHFPAHCEQCRCRPFLGQNEILGRSDNTVARELLEAFYIKKKGDQCVSDTSLLLRASEFDFSQASR